MAMATAASAAAIVMINKVKNKKIIRLNKFNQEFINVYSVKPSNLVMFVIQKE